MDDLPPGRKRPTREGEGKPSLYRPEYCDAVIEDMGNGYSLTAFAGKIGVSRRVLSDWANAHPDFAAAVDLAKACRLRKWETMAVAVAEKGSGGPGSASVITFGLKNMGGDEWSDTTKHEHTGKDGAAIAHEFKTVDEFEQAARRVAADI